MGRGRFGGEGSAVAGLEGFAEEPSPEGVEFEFSEEGAEGGFVGGAEGEVVDGFFNRDLGADGGEAFGEEGLFGELFDALLLLSFEVAGVSDEVFDGAVLLDEGFGGFFAEAGDAGDVVRGVAPEAEDVGNLRGVGDEPFFADGMGVDAFGVVSGAAGFVDEGAVGDQLCEVLVGGDHVGEEALGFGEAGDGSDDVVGFPSGVGEEGNAKGFGEAFDLGDGGDDVFGDFVALGFVGGIDPVALGRLRGVHGNGEVGGLLLFEEVDEGGGEAVEGGGVDAGGGGDGRAHEGEVGPVDEGHSIEQEEGGWRGGFHAAIKPGNGAGLKRKLGGA